MKKLLLALSLLASPSWALDDVPQPWQGGTGAESPDTRAGAPSSPVEGIIFVVNDGRENLDCATGGVAGTNRVLCVHDGTAFRGIPLLAQPASASRFLVTQGLTPFGLEYTGATPSCGSTGGQNLGYDTATRDFTCTTDLRFRSIATVVSTTAGQCSWQTSGTVTLCCGTGSAVVCFDTSAVSAATYLKLDASNDPLTGALSIGSDASSISADALTSFSTGGAGNSAGQFTNNTDAASVDVIELFGPNRATPADNDLMRIVAYMDTDTGSRQEIGYLTWKINDVTNGTIDGEFRVNVRSNSVDIRVMQFASDSGGTQSFGVNPLSTDLDMFVRGLADTQLFRTDALTDRVSIGDATPDARFEVQALDDELQSLITAHATQTADIFHIETNAGANLVAVDKDGDLTLTNGNGNIGWGTYTPVLTNVANLAASTAYQAQYIRVGNTVTVSGKVDVDPTLTATSTQLGIALPIASNIGAVEDVGGTAFAQAIAGQGAAILGDAANNRAQMEWIATDITNQAMYFTFTYQVI